MSETLNQNSLKGLMGLCVRARQAVFGMDGCLNALRSGKADLLLLDAAASPATADKYCGVCESSGAEGYLLPEGLLYEATGKPGVAMAIQAGGFSERIRNLPGMKVLRLSRDEDPESNNLQNHCGGASVE